MAEPQTEKNNESGNHQTNEIKSADLNSSAITDEYSILEFHTPKIEYTRSQLIDIGGLASGRHEEVINKSSNSNDDVLSALGQCLNEDFWQSTKNSMEDQQKIFDLAFEQTQSAPTLDDDKKTKNNAKVDRWLNSGQDPSEYANLTKWTGYDDRQQGSLTEDTSGTLKADEVSSIVSNSSAIRAKLLDKTARVKNSLRKMTRNN